MIQEFALGPIGGEASRVADEMPGDESRNEGNKPERARPMEALTNADMRVGDIRRHCKLDAAGEALVRAAMGQMNLSAPGYHRLLKLARTIADLTGNEKIEATHRAEALQYRPRTMKVRGIEAGQPRHGTLPLPSAKLDDCGGNRDGRST